MNRLTMNTVQIIESFTLKKISDKKVKKEKKVKIEDRQMQDINLETKPYN